MLMPKRYKKHKMDQHLFILCDTKEDVKNVWLWCYEHDYVCQNSKLEHYIEAFDRFMEDEDIIKPLMMCVDLEGGQGLLFATDTDREIAPIPDHQKKDPFAMESFKRLEYEKDALKFKREHAIHASDLDFDFLNVRR